MKKPRVKISGSTPIRFGNHDALANFLKQKIKECKSEEDASEYRKFLKMVIEDKNQPTEGG